MTPDEGASNGSGPVMEPLCPTTRPERRRIVDTTTFGEWVDDFLEDLADTLGEIIEPERSCILRAK